MAEQQELTDYEQSNLELEVLQRNHSVLYRAISADDIVSSLFQDKLITQAQMEDICSRTTGGAKNTTLLTALRRRVSSLQPFCRILSNTPGQEYLGEKLLRDYEEMKSQAFLRKARKRPSASENKSVPVKVSRSTKRLTPSSRSFGLFLRDLITILEGDHKAIANMKVILKSMTLPLQDEDGEDELPIVITSADYKNATTIIELVDALAPCWNEIDCDLLDTLVRASCSEAAIKRVEEFLGERDHDMPLVVRTSQRHTAADTDATVGKLTTPSLSTPTPDESSAMAKQSADVTHPYVLLPLVADNSTDQPLTPVGAVVVMVRTSNEQITIAEMHSIKEATCHNLRLPKEAMVYIQSLTGSVTFIFFMSVKLIRYLHAQVLRLRELYSLRTHGVYEIIIPDQYHLIVPSLENLEYLQASQFGYSERVLSMIESGVPVDVTDPNGETALTLAALHGHHRVVELLVRAGASLDHQTKDGFSALMCASQEGHEQVADVLLRGGASPHLQLESGVTALTTAAFQGHHQVVELLVRAGASLDHQKKDGFSALMLASQEGHEQVADVLLRGGASPQLQNEEGFTALHIACQFGHPAIVSLLLRSQADLHLTARKGRGVSPLMLACLYDHSEVVDVLLEAGADVNQHSREGQWTALMFAAESGDAKVVKTLVEHGANVNAKNAEGFTALDVAIAKDRSEVQKELLKHKAMRGSEEHSESDYRGLKQQIGRLLSSLKQNISRTFAGFGGAKRRKELAGITSSIAHIDI